VLGHGAGGGVESIDLLALADAVPSRGWRVVLVEQPWRVAGKKVAPAPASLDAAWLEVLADLRVTEELPGVLVVGGRSAGARVACRTATDVGAAAAVLLAFPLHPPGRPDKDRSAEFSAVRLPVLVVQGERDAFGSADDLRRAAAGADVVAVPTADHALRVPRSAPITQAEVLALITSAVGRRLAEWGARARR